MGLMRYAYNAVVRWNRYRRFYTKNSHIGPSQRVWVKPQPIKDKLKLYADVRVGKDVNEREDKKLQKSCVWGERKFVRTIVHIGMLLQGTHGKAPANIIDEAIDEALTARYDYFFFCFKFSFIFNFFF
jgi:hypothetical protein